MTPFMYVAPQASIARGFYEYSLVLVFDFRLPQRRLGKVKASFALLSLLLRFSSTVSRHAEWWALSMRKVNKKT